jgi:hypothetical protein
MGARPADWAYLFEPYARPANEVIFDQLGVGEGPGCWISPAAPGSPLRSPPGAAQS